NHVERANRRFRFTEKLRYKWRRRKWVVRFVLLALDRSWRAAGEAAQRRDQAGSAERRQRPLPSKAAGLRVGSARGIRIPRTFNDLGRPLRFAAEKRAALATVSRRHSGSPWARPSPTASGGRRSGRRGRRFRTRC